MERIRRSHESYMIRVATIMEERDRELASLVREYVLSQSHLWCQLPSLALEADGRNGYSGFLQELYCSHMYGVGGAYIDLREDSPDEKRSGRIIKLPRLYYPEETKEVMFQEAQLAPDHIVASLAPNMGKLDAERIIADLHERINTPYRDEQEGREAEEWRRGLKQKLGYMESDSKIVPLRRVK